MIYLYIILYIWITNNISYKATLPTHMYDVIADMDEERKILQREAYPQLQEYGRQHGVDFYMVDLRWGAGRYVDWDLTSTGLHVHEINSCQRHSIGPCFVVSKLG